MYKPPMLGESGKAAGEGREATETAIITARVQADVERTRVTVIDAQLIEAREAAAKFKLGAQAPELPAEIGTLLRDRYELESVIGIGSMGVVYRALDHLHEEMQDRDPYVAIKILNEQLKGQQTALMALQRETRKAQTLAHENIVTVYNFDRDDTNVFMTMELLDGKSLRAIIKEQLASGLPHEEVVRILRCIARALAYAHDNGIVHSDLKPANVYVTSKQQVKVLDFGVARALPGSGAEPLDVGQVAGMTPAYASPEMLAGEDVLPADDVFALGIIAHELTTGLHPFGRFPADAERLSQHDASVFNHFSRSQKRALARALAPEREARPSDAGAFLAEFEGKSPLRIVAWGSLAAALTLGALAVYIATRDVGVRPAIAFADLPTTTQVQFNDAVREGDTALGFGSAGINEAFQYFSTAYDLHPNNERAIAGLQTVADRFLGSLEGSDAATQRGVFSLLLCQAYLPRYAPVTRACDARLGASQCADIVSRCPAGD